MESRSWSKRMRMYNHFVQGNAELISIASDDSIWNSDSDNDDDEDNADPAGEKDEVDGEEEMTNWNGTDCSAS